jgi:hypothetical protein
MREDGLDQRRSKRVPRRSAAWIERVDDGTRIPCVVWDISEGGARLAAPRPAALPPAFKLRLTSDGDAGRLCRVVWRNDRQLGVEFVGAWAEDVARGASKPSDARTPAESAAR